MSQETQNLPENYRAKIWKEVGELLFRDTPDPEIEGKDFLYKISSENNSIPALSNSEILGVMTDFIEEGGSDLTELIESLIQMSKKRRNSRIKSQLRRGIPKKQRKVQTPKRMRSLSRENALLQLQKILDKNLEICRSEGIETKHKIAEIFLSSVEYQLAKKSYTYTQVLSEARRLQKEKYYLSPISVSNAVVDRLSRRANLKISVISTPTRR